MHDGCAAGMAAASQSSPSTVSIERIPTGAKVGLQHLLPMQVAVACIKVASQAVKALPSLLLFPLLPFAATVLLFAYWVAVAACLYSAGDIVPTYLSATQLQPMVLSVSTLRLHTVPRML